MGADEDLFANLEEAWERAQPKPRVVILSFPHNPTTTTVDLEFMHRVVGFAREHELLVVHDFAYADLAFDGYEPPSILQVPGADEVAVELYTLTKSFSMAGWRVGFVVGNAAAVGALARLKSWLDYGTFQPIQIAAIVAMNELPDYPARGLEDLRVAPGRTLRRARAGGMGRSRSRRGRCSSGRRFRSSTSTLGSLAFAEKVAREASVAVSPGVGFGQDGDGFVRFALVENEQRIGQAVRGIRRLLEDVLERHSLARGTQRARRIGADIGLDRPPAVPGRCRSRLRIPLTSAALVIATMAVAVTISASPCRRGHELHAVGVLGHEPSRPRGAGRAADQPAPRGQGPLPARRLVAAHCVGDLEVAAHGGIRATSPTTIPAPPVARTAHARAIDCGYGGGPWGENIAWGYTSPQSVVNGWLGSSGHKANIENPSFTSTGVGVAANANGSLYWTQSSVTTCRPPARRRPHLPRRLRRPHLPRRLRRRPHRRHLLRPRLRPPLLRRPIPDWDRAHRAPPGRRGRGAGTRPRSQPAPGTLAVGGTPARVVNGKHRSRLHASVSFVNLADGKPFATGSVRCRAEVSGRRLRVVANVFKGDAASCAWRIPRWARGKQLTGVVAVQVDDASATRLFIRRVR